MGGVRSIPHTDVLFKEVTVANPTIQRRRLGLALKKAREQAGMTQDEAAVVIDAASSKISRLELGQSGVRSTDLTLLLGAYSVTGEEAASMRDLAKAGRQRGQWSSFRDLLPSWFRQYVDLEGDASQLRWYQAEIIPGIMQTEAYIRGIVADSGRLTEEEVKQQVTIRLQRQSILSREDGPEMAFVLSESALLRAVDGPVTMRDQLHRLVEISSTLPNVTIQVLPLAAKTYTVASFNFTILRFEDDPASDVIYTENFTTADYLDRPDAVKTYTRLWDDLRAAALGPVESRLLISQLADQLEKSQ
jgi:transcriptional regulator with XRE-family HTH domain